MSEKRRVQRITLQQPLGGSVSKQAVRIVDLSTMGARVEHSNSLGGRRMVELRFEADGEVLTLRCELVRSRLQRSVENAGVVVYSSGLRFSDPTEDARAEVRVLVAQLVERRVLAEEREHAPLSVAV